MKLSKFSLGGTAGIITSMGLIAGLNFGAHAKINIISALLIIAIADNISDSFGIHVYKESETNNQAEIFSTTFGNFFTRLFLVLSFVVLVLFLPSNILIWMASLWGLLVLAIISFAISKTKKTHPAREILLHLAIAILVIVASAYLGNFISKHLS